MQKPPLHYSDCVQAQKKYGFPFADVLAEMKDQGYVVYSQHAPSQGQQQPVEYAKGYRELMRFIGGDIRKARDTTTLKQKHMYKGICVWGNNGFAPHSGGTLGQKAESGGHFVPPEELIQLSAKLAPNQNGNYLWKEWMGKIKEIIGENPTEEALDCLEVGVNAAIKAGDYLNTRDRSEVKPISPEEVSNYATTADCRAESRAAKIIKADRKDDLVIGEEGTQGTKWTGSEEDGRICWCLDALDGTLMFMKELPLWCTSIGCVRWNERDKTIEPIIGIIYNPPNGELFLGIEGGRGCVLDVRSPRMRPLIPSGVTDLRDAFCGVHLSTSYPNELEQFTSKILVPTTNESRRVVALGSGGLAMAYVACGRLDVFANIRTHAWDVAGALQVVRSAVAGQGHEQETVTDFYGGKWSLDSQSVLATATPELNQVVSTINRVLNPCGQRS